MFSKKFISFTVISGVLASTISQLGFAENDNIGSLETLSSSEDLVVKDETEKVEDLNKNENSGDDSSTDVEDLEGGEDNEDHEGTENKARSVVNLYQRGKEALVNKFEDVKPYLKKGKDVLKKVVNHDAFLPTFTGLASAAGTYKLLEKLNNRNTTNEHLTQVQVPEQPQEDVVTPSSTKQQDTSSEEEINKKNGAENNDSDVTNTSDLPQNDQVVDEKDNRVRDSVIFAFVILILGGATVAYSLLKTKNVPKKNKKYLDFINFLEKLSNDLYKAPQLVNIGRLFNVAATKSTPFYNYLKKVGLIKGNEESVKFTTFPYFKLGLKNFEDVSSPKVDVLFFNVFIDGEEIGEDRGEFVHLIRKDGFGFRFLGKKLTFNLADKADYDALMQLVMSIYSFHLRMGGALTEEQQKNNDIKAILGHLLVSSGNYRVSMESVANFADQRLLLSEVDLYKVLCQVYDIEIEKEIEIKKDDGLVTKNIDTNPGTSLNLKDGGETIDIDIKDDSSKFDIVQENDENNEAARIKSKSIKTILDKMFYGEKDMSLREDVILNEEDLFAILKEKFLKINMPEDQREGIFEKPKMMMGFKTEEEIGRNIIQISSDRYNNNFKKEGEYGDINQNDMTEENYFSFENKGNTGFETPGSEQDLNNNIISGNIPLRSLSNNNIIIKNSSSESNEENDNIDNNIFDENYN